MLSDFIAKNFPAVAAFVTAIVWFARLESRARTNTNEIDRVCLTLEKDVEQLTTRLAQQRAEDMARLQRERAEDMERQRQERLALDKRLDDIAQDIKTLLKATAK